jgi:hypothetical protein
MFLDYVIIGGGMAGLYMGMQLKARGVRFKILEKESRLGGRAWTEPFGGVDVSPGAGIGRRRKDKLLMQLMNDLDIPIHFFRVKHYESPRVAACSRDIHPAQLIEQLHSAYLKQNRPRTTFKSFASQVWGKSVYDCFILVNGYTDMEAEDIEQTLHYYGLEDNLTQNWQAFSVPWAKLVQRMAKGIGASNIRTDQRIQRIQRLENDFGFMIQTPDREYYCKTLVMATPTPVIQHYFPEYSWVYAHIPTQPFLRVYVQFNPESAQVLKGVVHGMTHVSNMLQKIIPIQPQKGVYMIAYSDNVHALRGKTLTKKKIVKCLQQEFGIQQPLKILKIKHYFWKMGTHYYKPLDGVSRKDFLTFARHPESNLYVIGESVSLNQGWVQGALESVKTLV